MFRKIGGILFLLAIALLLTGQVLSYDNLITHPMLSEAAAELFNGQTNKKLTQEQINWIKQGSIAEDTDPRYLNHYYDPTTGLGLNGYDELYGVRIKVNGRPAKAWAQYQDSVYGDYSEPAIIKNYQDGDLRRAYQGIGHILHLIQDMSVPAHTRNDSHAMGDPYEKWAQQNGKVNAGAANFIKTDNLNQAFDEMANYSNNNFLSKDTVKINDYSEYEIKKESVSGIDKEYLINGFEGGKYKLISIDRSGLIPIYEIDNFNVHQDYWNMLYPKAVGYSAGVIDYFVKQFERIDADKKEEEAVSWWQSLKNDLADYREDVKYNWGDVFFASRSALVKEFTRIYAVVNPAVKVAERGYDYLAEASEAIVAAEEQVYNNINQAISDQAKRAGKVLSAQESETKAKEQSTAKTKEQPAVKKTEAVVSQPQTSKIIASADKIGADSGVQSPANKTILTDNDKIDNQPFNNNLPSAVKNSENKLKRSEVKSNVIAKTPAGIGYFLVIGGSDDRAPETAIVSFPAKLASSTVADFSFSSDEGGDIFQCRLDNDVWQDCGRSQSFTGLSDGQHALAVRAVDLANNKDQIPDEYGWTIDTTAPTSTIAALAEQYQASGFFVSWSGSDPAGGSGLTNYDVQYKINQADWQDWLSATTSASAVFSLPLTNGQDVAFRARAHDLAGNVEAWPDDEVKIASTQIINPPVITAFNLNSRTSSSTSYTASTTVELIYQITNPSAVNGYYLSGTAATPAADDAGWQGLAPTNFTLPEMDGNKTVYLWLKYNNSVGGGASSTIILDTSAPASPSLTSPEVKDGVYWVNSNNANLSGAKEALVSGISLGERNVAATSSDLAWQLADYEVGFACANMELQPMVDCADSLEHPDFSTEEEMFAFIRGLHTKKINLAAEDEAGNRSLAEEKEFRVDFYAPKILSFQIKKSVISPNIYLLTATDESDTYHPYFYNSGIKQKYLQYKISGGEWQEAELVKTDDLLVDYKTTISEPGDYLARAQVVDWAGNVSAWSAELPFKVSYYPVFSEIYGGGGNSGAYWNSDFIELYNAGAEAVSVDGWSAQYAAATSNNWTVTVLSGTIPARGYYLIKEKQGSGGTADLPAADASGGINLAATAGKVALVNNTEPISGLTDVNVIDFVGYGNSASEREGGSRALGMTNTASIERQAAFDSDSSTMAAGGAHELGGNGWDANSNGNDWWARSIPEPQNGASAAEAPMY